MEYSEKNERYSIPLDTFTSPLTEMRRYQLGGVVERNNLMDYWIKSFRISKGKGLAQDLFFAWTERNFGFDYKQSFANLLLAGGWSCFCDQEKDIFISQFRAAERHQLTKFVYPRTHLFGKEVKITDYAISRKAMKSLRETVYPVKRAHGLHYSESQLAIVDGLSVKELLKLLNDQFNLY